MYATGWAADGGTRVYCLQTGVTPPPGSRGKIYGFSRASRRRLTDKLMAVPWNDIAGPDKHATAARGLLLTLTYGCDVPADWRRHKTDLDNFRRRLSELLECSWGAIWRMEYQKRGAPHFHILLTFGRAVNVRGFQDWARHVWTRLVGNGDKNHLEWGVDVRPLYRPAGAKGTLLRYLIKYLGKTDDQRRFGGRIWGGWNDVPQAIRTVVLFDTEQAWVEFRRRIRRWGKRSKYLRRLRQARGIRLFGLDAAGILSLSKGIEGMRCVPV